MKQPESLMGFKPRLTDYELDEIDPMCNCSMFRTNPPSRYILSHSGGPHVEMVAVSIPNV